MPREPGARRENRPLAAERAVLCPARLSVRRCALPSPVSLQAEGPADSGHKDLPKGLTHRSPRPHAPRSLVTPASRDHLLVHSPVLLQSGKETGFGDSSFPVPRMGSSAQLHKLSPEPQIRFQR